MNVLRGHVRARYLSPREFSARTGVAVRTVQEWCEKGLLRTRDDHVSGTKWRIVASEADRVIRERGRG